MKRHRRWGATLGVGSLVAAALAFPAAAEAAVLAADNFTASSGSNVGTVNNTESIGVGTYSTVQGSLGMSITTVSGFGDGNVLALNSSANGYYRAFDGGQTVTLNGLTVGQTLSFGFDVRFTGSFTGADNFSFGFVNFAAPNSVLYANIDLRSSDGLTSEFRYRTGSFNMSDAGSVITGGTFPEPATVSGGSYALELSVTRLSGGVRIDYRRNDVLVSSLTQNTGGTFLNAMGNVAITGIAFRHSQVPAVTTHLDNINVIIPVPEPMTAMLVLGGGVTMLALRRRRAA